MEPFLEHFGSKLAPEMVPGRGDKIPRRAKKPEGVGRWLHNGAISSSQGQKPAKIEPE